MTILNINNTVTKLGLGCLYIWKENIYTEITAKEIYVAEVKVLLYIRAKPLEL